MSIEPGEKPSLLAPLADEYELDDAGADRLIARIDASIAQDAGVASASVKAARGGGMGKNLLLIGASCLALAVAGGLVVYERSNTETAAPSNVTNPHVVPDRAKEAPREAENVSATPSITVESLPSAPPETPPPPAQTSEAKKTTGASSAAAAVPGGAASADTLGRETQLITSARAALKAGNPDKALALLEEHARLFPNGWLANDRIAERIVVLCTVGRRAEAAREAKSFLDGRPKSPLTRRVEASCAVEPPTRAAE